jgi:hypothetical protein
VVVVVVVVSLHSQLTVTQVPVAVAGLAAWRFM